MKRYLPMFVAAAISIVSSLSYGEIHFGEVSGIESLDEKQSFQSARDAVASIAKEEKYIWIQPLGTKSESTKSGKTIVTIYFKAATATPSKYTLEEQARLLKEFEKKHGLASRSAGGLSPPALGL